MSELSEIANQQNTASGAEPVSKINLIEERLKIDVQKVETGTVQVHKKVIAEEVTQEVPVVSETIDIVHKPINEYVDSIPAIRVEGDTTIISVVKEVLVVEKRLMLVEEVHLTKKQTTAMATVTETLLKDTIEINRISTTTENTNTTNQ